MANIKSSKDQTVILEKSDLSLSAVFVSVDAQTSGYSRKGGFLGKT